MTEKIYCDNCKSKDWVGNCKHQKAPQTSNRYRINKRDVWCTMNENNSCEHYKRKWWKR